MMWVNFKKSTKSTDSSITSVYNKLNGLEVNTSAELVMYAAGEVTPIITGLKGTRPSLLPGKNVKLLDGNCIEASEHRIKELRNLQQGRFQGNHLWFIILY